eukprot:10427804-Ditylum_brightwellii.AAC.1
MLRHVITTAWAVPASASSLALDFPSPDEAPVMTMTFPADNAAMSLAPKGWCMSRSPSFAA